MTAREYVFSGMKKYENNTGVDGYRMTKPFTNFDGPLVKKIHAGKNETYIDLVVKAKSIVPEAKYDISYDWMMNKRSNFSKDKRHTLATDIERKAKKDLKPEPGTYSPRHKLVDPTLKGCFNL